MCKDPASAVRAIAAMLREGGHTLIHTVAPGFGYHPFPRDYLRFHRDWFEDVPVHVALSLHDLRQEHSHLFAAYRKVTWGGR